MKTIKAVKQYVVCAWALTSGCLVWYSLIMIKQPIMYINAVSTDVHVHIYGQTEVVVQLTFNKINKSNTYTIEESIAKINSKQN